MTFIRHDAKISVGPRNIDVALELTFHEYPSLAERRRMDRNHDDTITETEIKGYLDSMIDLSLDALTLSVDDRPLQVIPLYDPRIDLLDATNVAPSHHVLRLSWFARTPPWLKAGSRIRAQYRLWPEAPRIDVLSASGDDGFRVIVDDLNNPVSSTEKAGGPREIRLSCQAAPVAISESLSAAASAGQAGMSNQDKLMAGIGAVFLLMVAAGVAGGIRRYVIRNTRTGGWT
ncbi:MAG: hypothetical protein GX616_01685 [Planctomycetes bacterium]|nr:hypothetical protein [Planctomycetota bacterium]